METTPSTPKNLTHESTVCCSKLKEAASSPARGTPARGFSVGSLAARTDTGWRAVRGARGRSPEHCLRGGRRIPARGAQAGGGDGGAPSHERGPARGRTLSPGIRSGGGRYAAFHGITSGHLPGSVVADASNPPEGSRRVARAPQNATANGAPPGRERNDARAGAADGRNRVHGSRSGVRGVAPPRLGSGDMRPAVLARTSAR